MRDKIEKQLKLMRKLKNDENEKKIKFYKLFQIKQIIVKRIKIKSEEKQN